MAQLFPTTLGTELWWINSPMHVVCGLLGVFTSVPESLITSWKSFPMVIQLLLAMTLLWLYLNTWITDIRSHLPRYLSNNYCHVLCYCVALCNHVQLACPVLQCSHFSWEHWARALLSMKKLPEHLRSAKTSFLLHFDLSHLNRG